MKMNHWPISNDLSRHTCYVWLTLRVQAKQEARTLSPRYAQAETVPIATSIGACSKSTPILTSAEHGEVFRLLPTMSSTISSTARYGSMANCSARPFELPKKSKKIKWARKVYKYHLMIAHMVAAADATTDSTMHREYVVDANISNYRVVKVLPDTGPTLLGWNSGLDWIDWAQALQQLLSTFEHAPSTNNCQHDMEWCTYGS